MSTDRLSEFIRRIPKTDLHLHLDGSLRIGTLIELARAQGVTLPSYEEAGLAELVFKPRYADLGEYLRGFAYTTAVLQDPESIERAAFELAEDALAEGVRYIEVRFAPQLHVQDAGALEPVLAAVTAGLDRARTRHNASSEVCRGPDLPFEFGIIVCALRSFGAGMSPYFARMLSVLANTPRKKVFAAASLELVRAAVEIRDRSGLPIVGFDLAGEEAGYPASAHTDAYCYAHTHFLKKTVHAGEAYGPESIFQAITECHANRIGHGTFLFAEDAITDPAITDRAAYVESLIEYMATQRITVEVCLTSNLQTIPQIADVKAHPLRRMIEHGLSVSICTDNRLVSHTSVSRELETAVTCLDLHPRQIRNLVAAGFKGSFFPHPYRQKRAFVRRVLNRYEELEAVYRAAPG
jgi:adenosine deaminase